MKYKLVKNLIFLVVGLLLVIAVIMPKGSFSFFNDVETVPMAIFAAGTCEINAELKNKNMTSNSDLEFNLMNLMPEDKGNKINKGNKGNKGIKGNKGTKTIKIKKQKEALPVKRLNFDIDLAKEHRESIGAIDFAKQFKITISLEERGGKQIVLDGETIATLLMDNERSNSVDITGIFPNDEINATNGADIRVEIEFVEKSGVDQTVFEQQNLHIKLSFEGIC